MTDPTSDKAIIARHREFFRTVHPDIRKAALEAFEAKQENFRLAVYHLEKVLNGCRSAAEQQAADTAARDWLTSIGSEPN